ncbi:ion transporter [Bacteriovoracaceae bacterium]|nr:ion transporter [Bacteriovoracaceae bacterium]
MKKLSKKRIYTLLERANEDRMSFFVDCFLMVVILLNLLMLILETVDSIYSYCPAFFDIFETVSVCIFLTEYILRVISCTSDKKYHHGFIGRIRFIFTPMALIDLIAILPFFLSFATIDLRFMRMLRLLRLFRILKMARYSKTVGLFGRVFRSRIPELTYTLTIIIFLLIASSCIMYFVENGAQPEQFSSIPATMWWSIATLTTVGYGDIYPVTTLGKFFGAVIAILGIGIFALPTGVLGAAFLEVLRKEKVCPHCGNKVDD